MVKEDMRLVEITVLTKKARKKVLEIIRDEDIEFTLTAQGCESDADAVVSFPFPTRAVEPLRDRLHDLGIGDDIYTIVTEPAAVTSRQIDQLGEYDSLLRPGRRHRISRSELHSQASDLLPHFSTYLLLCMISAILVTSGILLDSTTVLVGSMVISPLIWPPLTAGVSTVLDDHALFLRSIKLEIAGIAAAVGSSFSFAFLIKTTPIVLLDRSVDSIPHMSSYTAPPFLLIVVALSAGIAGALSLGSRNLTGLVGILAAVAVVLPAGVLGTALAWGRVTIIIGTSIVLFLNLLAVTFSGTLILWYLGYHPPSWRKLRKTRSMMLRRLLFLTVLMVLFIIVLIQLTNGNLNYLPGVHYS